MPIFADFAGHRNESTKIIWISYTQSSHSVSTSCASSITKTTLFFWKILRMNAAWTMPCTIVSASRSFSAYVKFLFVRNQTNSKCMQPIVASSDDRTKTTDPNIVYYSNERLATLIKILISFASTTLLLAPTFLFLSFDLSIAWMALITSAFAFIFSAAASMLTNANRQGVFAATAAYCAVLVVVISVVQQGRSFQPPLADRECYFPMVENLKPMLVSLKHLWPNSTSSYVFFTLFCIVSIMFCICFALFCMFFYLYTRKTRGIPGQPERLQ